MDILKILLNFTLMGGEWVLYILLILSLLSIAVMIERAYFFRSNRVDIAAMMSAITGHMVKGETEKAIDAAASVRSVEGRVIEMGLRNMEKGRNAAGEMMTAKIISEKLELDKNLIFLGTLGNNAPFIGLFGTVLGIIKAFNDLSITGSGSSQVVMKGISEALVATAVGLFVAIPAVVAFNYFQRRSKTITANAEASSRMILSIMPEKGE